MTNSFSPEQEIILWNLARKLLAVSSREEYLETLPGTLEQYSIETIFRGSSLYPPLLEQIKDPPPVLFVQGNAEVLSTKCIAVVGTRNSTFYGRQAAFEISRSLSEAGMTVVSGLAKGIDLCAHKACVEFSRPTIAVLGCGLDRCYPPANDWLKHRILEKGAVLSEFPPGTQVRKWTFLHRNRLISGLSLAAVVVQAGVRSGAVNTAQHAADQGRDVWAVPGSIFEASSSGVHHLIEDGAQIVTRPSQIAERYASVDMTVYTASDHPVQMSLPPFTQTEDVSYEEQLDRQQQEKNEKAGEYLAVYQNIGEFGTSADDLCCQCAMSARQIQTALTVLEMRRLITRGGAGLIYRL